MSHIHLLRSANLNGSTLVVYFLLKFVDDETLAAPTVLLGELRITTATILFMQTQRVCLWCRLRWYYVTVSSEHRALSIEDGTLCQYSPVVV